MQKFVHRLGLVIAIAIAGRVVSTETTAPGAQPPTATSAAATDAEIDKLERGVTRAESIRAVKRLQTAYQQFAQFGLWDEMAGLFSDTADATFGDRVVHSKTAIGEYLLDTYGGGRQGLPAGGLHNQILLAPVVTLSYDGGTAQGRWSEVTMLGRYGERAEWEGGMEENDYIKQNGIWKIARLRFYRQFAGPYETGWFSLPPDKQFAGWPSSPTPNSPIVPYHYSPSQAGRPVPDEPGDADRTSAKQGLDEIERRIAALNDEDKIRNLQNAYGYYVDRKMWDDVTDLFAPDGVLEIAGIGIYDGVKGIRRALERDGPAGLRTGEVNDELQLDTIVTVEPNGIEARARGLQLGMLTPKVGEAYWSVSTFENRYTKFDGVWHIREMRIFPKMKTDYYQGWGKSAIVDPPPAPQFAPDHPTPSSDAPGESVIPVFDFPNPGTGKDVRYPSGARIVSSGRITPAPSAAAPAASSAPTASRIADARHKLEWSKAYDAVDNVSSTFGYYMDDFLWDEWTENMSTEGRRIQGRGWYVGRDHMYRAMTQAHIGPPSLTNPRDGVRIHMRAQPVINVTPDGKYAYIRTRMWLYYANSKSAGAWNSGMYPNDAAILEDGVWKMDVDEIDETYFSSPSYKQGWAKPTPGGRGRGRAGGAPEGAPPFGGPEGAGRGISRNGNPIDFPPDIPTSLMDDFRRKNFAVSFPEIKPMWFAYRNPVSGRVPPYYCPDIKTCTR